MESAGEEKLQQLIQSSRTSGRTRETSSGPAQELQERLGDDAEMSSEESKSSLENDQKTSTNQSTPGKNHTKFIHDYASKSITSLHLDTVFS